MSHFSTIIKATLGPNITKKIRPFGHGLKAIFASWMFGRPASKLTIIGINATKGKTTTTILTGRLMNALGLKTGYISTAVFNLSGKKNTETINKQKNSTLDAFLMQKYLKKMVENGCKYVVLEMSSQGLEQNRHYGLGGFDVAVFMNIFPEHLDAHGGMEQYIAAKSKLFQSLKKKGTAIFTENPDFIQTSEQIWNSISDSVKKTLQKVYVNSQADFSITEKKNSLYKSMVIGKNIYNTLSTANFEIHNLYYALTIAKLFIKDLNQQKLKEEIKDITKIIPGRMEFVEVSKSEKIDIIVDYAHETGSMTQLMQTLATWKKRGFYDKIIHVVSCDGVGRDDWKKPVLGKLSYDNTDFCVITTDNYEAGDDPNAIVEMLAQKLPVNMRNKKYIKIIHRKDAMQKAYLKAKEYLSQENIKEVLVVSTGVGTEQFLTQPDGKLKWDERLMWKKISSKK